MIKFIKKLFKKKERYYFASYNFQLSNNKNVFGDIVIPHSRLNPNVPALDGIREYVKEYLQEYFKDNNVNIVIIFFTWQEQ